MRKTIRAGLTALTLASASLIGACFVGTGMSDAGDVEEEGGTDTVAFQVDPLCQSGCRQGFVACTVECEEDPQACLAFCSVRRQACENACIEEAQTLTIPD